MSILDNVRLSHKMAIGFGACLLLAALTVAIAISRMAGINSATRTIVERGIAESVIAGRLGADFRQYRVKQDRYILARDTQTQEGQLNAMYQMRDQVNQDFDSYEKLATSQDDRASVDKAREAWQQCLSFERELVTQGQAKNFAACDAIINHKEEACTGTLRDTLNAMVDWNTKQTKLLAGESETSFESARTTMFILLAISLALGIFVSILITRSILGATETLGGRMANLNVSLTDLAASLEAMGEGDLTTREVRHTEFLHWKRNDEFGEFARLFDGVLSNAKVALDGSQHTRQALSKVISQAMITAEQIADASNELASGNEELSSRTSEQASSLEETAASMEEMTSIVKQSAEGAMHASSVASESKTLAITGGEVVQNAVEAMRGIDESSKKIADIVTVIDEIAFQTNLLALNAAVEAARVGEQGRGFAVVAGEVRNLAGRSSTAAKEIKALVHDSLTKVQSGSDLVNESGEHLRKIVEAGESVAELVSSISASAQEQSAGIEQVNKAVVMMDEITQKNAALVEEAAASSEEMSQQAKELRDLVRRFKLDENPAMPASVIPAAVEKPQAATGTTGLPGWSSRTSTQKPSFRIVNGRDKVEELDEF
ncbi:MAG: methyl-accepting chemotaxis protein [Capsulimonadaceae bacterium]|nr:methyl-accepting chemotaxis protein [Capsulimonadaceae bacterium]